MERVGLSNAVGRLGSGLVSVGGGGTKSLATICCPCFSRPAVVRKRIGGGGMVAASFTKFSRKKRSSLTGGKVGCVETGTKISGGAGVLNALSSDMMGRVASSLVNGVPKSKVVSSIYSVYSGDRDGLRATRAVSIDRFTGRVN